MKGGKLTPELLIYTSLCLVLIALTIVLLKAMLVIN